MDLIVYQMMQLQVMHVTDGRGAVEILAGSSVPEQHLSIGIDGNALPESTVLLVLIQILVYLRKKLILMLLGKLFPFKIYIIIGQLQSLLNVNLIGSVKDRRGNIESQGLGRKT